MKTAIKSFSPAVLAILMIMPASQTLASNAIAGSQLIVKTSVAEVIGVREIESGNLEQGIRKSKAALAKSSTTSIRKPLLDNLCVANLAISNLEQANQFCNAAVNTGKSSVISYNNRAVMHYILGNLEASLEDLDEASNHGRFQNMVADNFKIVNQQSLLSDSYSLLTDENASFIATSNR
jgi:hypothetical protein